MPRPRLVNLKARGFRSFVDEVDIDFPSNGLILLNGQSGSGKSSLALAIAYAFDYSHYPATELASWPWLNPPPMRVQLTLEDETGKRVLICKGDSNYLEIDGKKIKGANQISAELTKFVGMEPERLKAVTYRPQKSAGFFLTQPDSKKKEFLTPIVGLSEVEDAVKAAQESIKLLNAGLPDLEAYKATWGTAVTNAQEAYNKLNSLIGDEGKLRSTVEEIARQEDLIKAKLEALDADYKREEALRPVPDETKLTRHRADLKECRALISSLEEEERVKIKEYNDTKIKNTNNIRRLQDKSKEITRALEMLTEIDLEIQKLQENICPTCDQTWVNAAERLEFLKSAREECVRTADLGPDIHEEYCIAFESNNKLIPPEHNITIDRLKKADTKIQFLIEEEKDAIRSVQGEYTKQVTVKYQELIKESMDSLFTVQNNLTINRKLLADMEVAKTRLSFQDKAVSEAIEKYKQFSDKVNETKQKINKEKDFVDMIGREGFLGTIFDEILDQIAIETNEVLAGIKNTERVVIGFRSESLTQKGTTDKSIVPVVYVCGNEVPLRSGLSGGMMSSTDLAVDLAIGSVISNRVGSFPSWLILDESFEGLDHAPKESCMEILKKYSNDRLILVVDHANEFKGLFDKTISFEFNEGRSIISS